MNIIEFSKPYTGNFIADIVLWLVQITSSVAAGVVLFTLLLKLITLPFDFFSRASMRKNSLKMEQMRPELEKLQAQYADNKDMYNQKMMALYKKNGYSMFGACLPSILTIVIFFFALSGFNTYSSYQNRQYFYDMSIAYNNVLYAGLETDENYIVRDEETGALVIDAASLLNELGNDVSKTVTAGEHDITVEKSGENLYVSTTNGYVKYRRTLSTEGELSDDFSFEVIEEKLIGSPLACDENNKLENSDGKTFDEVKDEVSAEDFLLDIMQLKSADRFHSESVSFLWIKNIWVTDSPTKHPVESSWDSFSKTYGYPAEGNKMSAEDYENLIAKLSDEQNAPNGYFILVALTAGMSFLTQFVMGRSQKAQMELQTVDGQGMQTQKIMMWMMPIMMAVFAFIYTAAFSIYIILSSLFSIGTTFLINFIVDKRFKKKTAAASGDDAKIYGRTYVPKEQPKEDKKDKKNKKRNKGSEKEKGDFLSGDAGVKHVRGRLK